MSKYVKVQEGNYKISVPNGNSITLDVGYNVNHLTRGTVYVSGNLVVDGVTTTVNSQTMTVVDNIIQLNTGETGNGVTANGRTSGIEINRGNYISGNGLFVLDETVYHYNSAYQLTQGTWTFKDALGNIMGIQAASINTNGNNLYLINNGTGYISTKGTTNYERQVMDYSDFDSSTGPLKLTSDPDAIPNTQVLVDYVNSAFTYNSANNITDYDTSVAVSDLSSTGNPSKITFKVDNNLKALIDGSGVSIDSIKIYANTVASLNNNNLVLSPVTNTIEANGWMLFDNQGSLPPNTNPTGTYLYANSTIGAGKSGLYVVNTTVTDELVSKNRALLFSMIF